MIEHVLANIEETSNHDARSVTALLRESADHQPWPGDRHLFLNHQGDRVVGFFPGLGSRAAYQNLGRVLLDSGHPEVAAIYREGARALNLPGRPEALMMTPENLPGGRIEQQGFIGAAFLVHNLAIAAHLQAVADAAGTGLNYLAYTGESFGIVASAVASGSLAVGDGVMIAHAFTPLMLLAAEGATPDGPLGQRIAGYLPASVRQPLVPEVHHVLGLMGATVDLAEALRGIGANYPVTDVEVHKTYSGQQTNVYVRAGAKPSFDLFVRRYPAVRVVELKPPTTFLAHSARMHDARDALERFMDDNDIVFHDPHTPVISNSGAGTLTTAAEVRGAVLAMTVEVMASQQTAEIIDRLDPDLVVEFGLGHKSIDLLLDNSVETPAVAVTGSPGEAAALLRAVRLVHDLLAALDAAYRTSTPPSARDHDLLRDLLRSASAGTFYERYFHRSVGRVITAEVQCPVKTGSPAFYSFLETVQHSFSHRDSIDVARGELVQRARLKKRIVGSAAGLGQVYAELRVIDADGEVADRSAIDAWRPEAVVFHFGGLAELDYVSLSRNARLLVDTQPLARRIYASTARSLRIADGPPAADPADPTVEQMAMNYIAYQYSLFRLLQLHRPTLFLQSDYYLEGSDPMGWLVALAAAGTLSLSDVVQTYGVYLHGTGGVDAQAALEARLSALTQPDRPVISPAGVPLQSAKDVMAATRTVLREAALGAGPRAIHLNGNCQILSLGSALDPSRVDTGPYRAEVIPVLSPTGIWTKRVNPALDDFEDRSVLTLTVENERVLRHAQGRRLLTSAVNSYVDIGERIVGFGNGGSESMTIFVARDGAA